MKIYPVFDKDEKIYYLELLKFKVSGENYLISFFPKLERINLLKKKEEFLLNEKIIYIREKNENLWYPLISGSALKFQGKNYKDKTICFDLKIDSPFSFPPGDYYLNLNIEMENAMLSKENEDFEKPILVKKKYKELGNNNFNVNLILENLSDKEVENLTIKETLQGEGKILKAIDFLPSKVQDKSIFWNLEKIKKLEKKEFNYIIQISALNTKFSTSTEIEGFLEGKKFKIKFKFDYTLIQSFFNGRGGIIGNLFFDKNNDIKRQEDEFGIKDALIILSNGREVKTDENGSFSFYGLLPDFYSIYYSINGNIFYFDTLFLKSFETINISIPIENINEENYTTNFLSLQFKTFFGRDGFFSNSFHLYSNYLFELSYNSNEKDIKRFYNEILSQFYNFPIFGDRSTEYEESRLKRKLSLNYNPKEKGISLYYGFSRGFFINSNFLRYNYISEGLNLSFKKEDLSFNFYAQRLFGEKILEFLNPNDSIGPFYLKYKPILFSSEMVVLEIRDKNIEERIISEKFLERNVDYYIDYDLGLINLYYPIASKTPDGNKIYIRIVYQKEIEKLNYNDFSYGLEFIYKNQGIRYLEIKAKPKKDKYFEFFGKIWQIEYSFAFEKNPNTKKGFRLDYKDKYLNFYIQKIDKGFENPSKLPIGDGFTEVGVFYGSLKRKFGISIGESREKFFYSNLFLEYPYKDYKIQNSIQYFEKDKKLFFGTTLLKDLWELHFSKSFKDYFFSYIYKKLNYAFELKLDKYEEYLSLKFGIKRKNLNLNFSKDFKENGNSFYEISYYFENDNDTIFQSSLRYEKNEDIFRFFCTGRKYFELSKNFYSFLDGRFNFTSKAEEDIFLNFIFGFRPFLQEDLSFFFYGFYKSNPENSDFVLGFNKKLNKINFNLQGKLDEKLFYFNSTLNINFYRNISFYFTGNYYKEFREEKNFGVGISIEKEKQKFLIGYNFNDFPDVFYQEKFLLKKGFYFGLILPIYYYKSFEEEKEKELWKLNIKGDYIKELGENINLEISTISKDGKVIPYSGYFFVFGSNERGVKFEKKLRFKRKDKGVKFLSLNFSKFEEEGSWVLKFYDKTGKEKGNFFFNIKRKSESNLFSFEEPEVYYLEKKEEIIVPNSFKIIAPEEARTNLEFEIIIKVISKEKKICKDYKGEVMLYLSDGTKILETPILFLKEDFGIKKIKIKIQKEGKFLIISQDKNNLNLIGISNEIEVKND